MKISVNKSFPARSDLDAYVRNTFGENPAGNAGVSIEMDPDEMISLALDESTTVHGVKIVSSPIKDEVVKEKQPARVVLGAKRKIKKSKK